MSEDVSGSNPAAEPEQLETDLLVIGAGMAGLTAACAVALAGARVLVIEKTRDIGGSAAMSGGVLWTAASYEVLREENSLGDPQLGRVFIDDFEAATTWLCDLGITASDERRMDQMMGFAARGRLIDILGYLRRCRGAVMEAGGWIVTNSTVHHLLTESDKVVGAVVEDNEGVATIKARWTLLASGGFQGDPTLRQKYISPSADHMVVRSNPGSVGDGLRLAQAVDASHSRDMDGFYGHTIPRPLPKGYHPPDYVRLAQLYSPKGIILDSLGSRFVDESCTYALNAQALVRLPEQRALLIADQFVRSADTVASALVGVDQVDRPTEAAKEGANVAEADSLEELAALVAPWGYPDVAKTIRAFNSAIQSDPATIRPPRRHHRRAIDQPPYFAVEIQPAITFTHGGIVVDHDCHVLREDGSAIHGLLAAGADAGGLFNRGYAGGLSAALVFGLRAARVAIKGTNEAG